MTEDLKRLLTLREELQSLLQKCIGQLEAQKSGDNKEHIQNVIDTARTINSTLEVLCNSLLLLERAGRNVN